MTMENSQFRNTGKLLRLSLSHTSFWMASMHFNRRTLVTSIPDLDSNISLVTFTSHAISLRFRAKESLKRLSCTAHQIPSFFTRCPFFWFSFQNTFHSQPKKLLIIQWWRTRSSLTVIFVQNLNNMRADNVYINSNNIV